MNLFRFSQFLNRWAFAGCGRVNRSLEIHIRNFIFLLDEYLPLPEDPCRPSPCGQFSSCRVRGNRPICSCLPNYMGQPPNCKPECVISAECPSDKACVNQRCVDPCPGTCGHNARCRVTNHSPICTCMQGYTGDPFHQCQPERSRFLNAANCFHPPKGFVNSFWSCRDTKN